MNFVDTTASITVPVIMTGVGYLSYIISSILLVTTNKRISDYRGLNDSENLRNASDNLYIAQIFSWIIPLIPILSIFSAIIPKLIIIIIAILTLGAMITMLIFSVKTLNNVNQIISQGQKDDISGYLIASIALISLSILLMIVAPIWIIVSIYSTKKKVEKEIQINQRPQQAVQRIQINQRPQLVQSFQNLNNVQGRFYG